MDINSNKQLNMYIPTCDDNSFVLKYFQYFFLKYWGDEINVKFLGFTKPKISFKKNFEFISLSKEQLNGAKGWSNYLIDFFNSINDDFFYFGIDDFMVVRPVDKNIIHTSINILDDKIGRIDLQPLEWARDRKYLIPYKESNGTRFFKLGNSESPFNHLYRNSGSFSIWNKKWFLKNIERNWSPWDWEILGSQKSLNDGFEVMGTYDKYAVKKSELLSKQWGNIINTTGIRDEDIEMMKLMSDKSDRITKFENYGYDTFGYYEYAGESWLEKIYGK